VAARVAAAGACIAAASCLLALPAHALPGRPAAREQAVAAVAAGWRQDLGDARTLGEGDLRWWGLRIYHARLIGERLPMRDHEPFALELTYYRDISREHIVAASLEEMQRLAADTPSPEQVAAWRQTLERCFVDVHEGDRLTGVYLPGRGVRFYRGDALLADVDDDAFARAFFAIWLDPRARDTRLRARLLGARD
jgi:hypothetical protein